MRYRNSKNTAFPVCVMASPALICIMNARLGGAQEYADAAVSAGARVKQAGTSSPADFIWTCGSISVGFLLAPAPSLAARIAQASASFKHLFVLVASAAMPPAEALAKARPSWILLPGASPLELVSFMCTTTRTVVASAASSSSVAVEALSLRPPACDELVAAVAGLFCDCAGVGLDRSALESSQDLLIKCGGSLSELASTHPQDVVDALGLDESAALAFGAAVHTPHPAALATSWPSAP